MDYLIHFEDDSTGYLAHHGIKGMKWGVRRYQNKDRTLTELGKRRALEERRSKDGLKTYEAANDIVKTLSGKEKDFLGASRNEPWVNPDDAGNSSKKIAKRVVVNDRKTGEPVSFIEIEDTGNRIGQIGIATKSGDRYRGKGYASEAVERGKDWFDRYGYKNLDMMEWIANNENVASINLAKKHGFEKVKMKDVHPEWGDYPDYTIMVYRGKGKVDRILGK